MAAKHRNITINNTTAKITTMKISTASVSFTTRLSRPSRMVSSMEPTSAFNKTSYDITRTTAAAVLSEECKHQIN